MKTERSIHAWEHLIVLHSLLKYAQEADLIERICWQLQNELTPNHRYQTLDELLDLVFAWLHNRVPVAMESSGYT